MSSPQQHPDPSHLFRIRAVRPEPILRGEKILRLIDSLFIRFNRLVEIFLPFDLNPLVQVGSIANTLFVIAIASGIGLLFWYSPSVSLAYESVQHMNNQPYFGGLFRSVHRYSSAAMMFFVVCHALKVFLERRFTGPRTLAWITGGFLLFMLWFDGWLGYWLTWDEAAKHIAVSSAALLDHLPIFAEPLTRAFLVDESVHSLLFFLVFFLHMLIPLGMIIALWLHVSRLSRPQLFPSLRMILIILGSLVFLSCIAPADLEKPARMLADNSEITIDIFYMLPFILVEMLGSGLYWIVFLCGVLVFCSLPFIFGRRAINVPKIIEEKCVGCDRCYEDCPYNAINRVDLEEARDKIDHIYRIDGARCVSCGVCVGSCDYGAIDFPALPVVETRKQIDSWLAGEEKPFVAFLCANSAAGSFIFEKSTGICEELPGYRVVPVSCTGWVNHALIERIVRRGAKGVLLIGCGPGDPTYRKGVEWTEQRMHGERAPALREEMIKKAKVQYLQFDEIAREELKKSAELFRKNQLDTHKERRVRKPFRILISTALLACFMGITYAGSAVQFQAKRRIAPELVISFKHPGQILDQSESKSDEHLLPHMRGGGGHKERKRLPVRLLVLIDGKEKLLKSFPPGGLFEDGESIAIEKIELSPGERLIEVKIADAADTSKWNFEFKDLIHFESTVRRVLLFDRRQGFKLY